MITISRWCVFRGGSDVLCGHFPTEADALDKQDSVRYDCVVLRIDLIGKLASNGKMSRSLTWQFSGPQPTHNPADLPTRRYAKALNAVNLWLHWSLARAQVE